MDVAEVDFEKTKGVNDSLDANYNSEIKPLIIQHEQSETLVG